MSQLTWDDVLKREDLIGGDIESQEDGVVYRGPLAEIKDDGDSISFKSPWCARMNPDTGEWEKWHITSSFINKSMARPQDIGDGRVFFQMPFLGVCTIFPKDGSKLDPNKVKDLDLATADKLRESTSNWSPISPGTLVKTTRENETVTDWTAEARASRRWGVQGEVMTHHDSHGLSYEVRHHDGSIGHYDPTEFEVV